MPARFLLPALWLLTLMLPVRRSQAQVWPLGPWRLTYQMVSEGKNDGWDVKPIKKTLKLAPTLVKWDVIPDSIRLFLNCENPLIAPARPRKGQLPIRFTATGATVRLDTKHQRLLVVPAAPVVILSAYRGQALVFKHQLQAILPPLPMLEPWIVNHRNATWCKGPPPDSTLTDIALSIKAVPDASFAAFMPNDALYRVSSYRIILLHDGTATGLTQVVYGPQASIEKPKASIHPGDKVQIDIQRVARKNFRGDVDSLPFPKQFIVALPL